MYISVHFHEIIIISFYKSCIVIQFSGVQAYKFAGSASAFRNTEGELELIILL